MSDKATYQATGKRKTSVARVTLTPGTGIVTCNGRPAEQYFDRAPLRALALSPLEAVGLKDRFDVRLLLHGGGVSGQAGATRHGIARALVEADPNLRGDLKRAGFLARDARAVEARKRPQFSKR
jgi:small subunit ribosomal protein S9